MALRLLRSAGYESTPPPHHLRHSLENFAIITFVFFVCMGLLFVNKLPVQYECLTTDYNLRNHM